MSVTDPFLKELKGFTSDLLKIVEKEKCITDQNEVLIDFCGCLEKIFYKGLKSETNFGFTKTYEPIGWIIKIGQNYKSDLETYQLNNALEHVQRIKNISSYLGKFRLFLRCCLNFRCIDAPLNYLINHKLNLKFYNENSIIGDEILSMIFLSVLKQISLIKFSLDVTNSAFLDYSWQLPHFLRLEIVPCLNVGIAIRFANDKAIIIDKIPHSVADEMDDIEIGDILDVLNNIYICSATKSYLDNILNPSKKTVPVTLKIIKAFDTNNQIFEPMINLLKQVDIDIDILKQNRRLKTKKLPPNENVAVDNNPISPGFLVNYIGLSEVNKKGSTEIIDQVVHKLTSSYKRDNCFYKKFNKMVNFELQQLGIKCYDHQNSKKLILEHSFLDILSCGNSSYHSRYFAYITREEYNGELMHICYVFSIPATENLQNGCTILEGIRQGFHRTHFAV